MILKTEAFCLKIIVLKMKLCKRGIFCFRGGGGGGGRDGKPRDLLDGTQKEKTKRHAHVQTQTQK